jgi:hypothetical protein
MGAGPKLQAYRLRFIGTKVDCRIAAFLINTARSVTSIWHQTEEVTRLDAVGDTLTTALHVHIVRAVLGGLRI